MKGSSDDTLIVGGGVIGCALAAELAARGQRVTLLERGEPGGEASGAAAGMLSPQVEAHSASEFFDLALESRGRYPAWASALFEETGLDVGYRRGGLLRCAFGDSHGDAEGADRDESRTLFASYAWQRRAGLAVEEHPPTTLAVELGGRLSPEVRQAVFFPDEASVDPPALVRAAWLSAQRRGARLLTGVCAQRFRFQKGVCVGVETDAGDFSAAATVDCAGAWAAFDPSGRVSVPVHPVRGQMVRLRLEGPPLRTMVCSDEVYCVPRPEGTVLVGSTVELVGFRKAVTAEALERLIGGAVALLPELRSAQFVSAWAGLRPGTPDGLPMLGESGIPGLFLATGHFRNGILLAPVTAWVMAELLTNGHTRDLSAFSVARFSESLAAAPSGRTDGNS
ncbi:MAG TPA: glycine oxidase ThiO [Thermoanaerobaculia bacterium]|jgi:glycine oxidase